MIVVQEEEENRGGRMLNNEAVSLGIVPENPF